MSEAKGKLIVIEGIDGSGKKHNRIYWLKDFYKTEFQ